MVLFDILANNFILTIIIMLSEFWVSLWLYVYIREKFFQSKQEETCATGFSAVKFGELEKSFLP